MESSDSDSEGVIFMGCETMEPSDSDSESSVIFMGSEMGHGNDIKIMDSSKSPVKVKCEINEEPHLLLHGRVQLPIYSSSNKFLSTQQAINVLLDSDLKSEDVCSQVPFSVPRNGIFVVDLSKLNSVKDILCDDMGAWLWGGSFKRWCSVSSHGMVKLYEKNVSAECLDSNSYHVWKRYYCLKSSPDVRKMVIILEDSDKDTLSLALVQYAFTQGEHEVKVAPHGNSRSEGAYIRTMPSVMNKLKAASVERTPKRAIDFCCNEQGDILTAPSGGSLPRSRQQVKDMRRKKQEDDPLFAVMYMCKSEEGKGKNPFVRSVNAAPFPMMVLTYNYTLHDLNRFCTGSSKFSVLGVDPTFSLGDFDVTVTTYQHLMLSTQQTSKFPVLFGPMFVHVKKDFLAYHFFSSSLIGLRPDLVNLKAYGTDGEAALAKALSASFPKACHLRCFLHFKGNVEQKMKELKMPNDVAKEFMEDIMGKPSCFKFGLVDAKDPTHLDELLNKYEEVWNKREEAFHSPPVFFPWFMKYERDVIAESMTHETRIKAGLGNPPTPYYTNQVESMNNVLKQHVRYKSSELPKFVDSMKELMAAQQKEIEKAIVGLGEYRIRSEYKSLAVDQAKWYTLSEAQRRRCVDRFMKADVTSSQESSSTSNSPNPLLQLSLPSHFVNDVWSKARKIASGDNLLVQCPGDSTAWMVQGEKGNTPHLVKPAKKIGGFLCDDQCLGYKCSKVCSHTVAVALKTGNVAKLIEWFRSRKRPATTFNVTALADSGKPAGAGKKRKGISKKASADLQSLLSNVSGSVWSYPHGSSSGETSQTSSDMHAASLPSPPGQVPVLARDASVNQMQPPRDPRTIPALLPAASHHSVAVSQTPPCVSRNTPQAMYAGAHQAYSIPGSIQVGNSSVKIGACQPSSVPSGVKSAVVVQQRRPQVESPFWVAFLFGNVSRCNGCKGNIQRLDGKPLPPPDNLILGHKESVIFINPKSGRFEQSWDKRNVYYHPRKACVAPSFLDFDPVQHIKVAADIKARLEPVHIRLLQTEFGVIV